MYQNVLATFQSSQTNGGQPLSVAVNFAQVSGLLTDELESGLLGGSPNDFFRRSRDQTLLVDSRQLQQDVGIGGYQDYQSLRNAAHLAISTLQAYDAVDSPALRGQLYAIAGYTELFLADLYCSGVPLSTIDFNADFTYRAGSTTDQLYQAAIAQFDTAITLSSDSVQVLNLARVGLGRAYLARGQYDSAAAAVHNVPTDYRDQFSASWYVQGGGRGAFWSQVSVADRQGGNGLPYRSNSDPRTTSVSWGKNVFHVPQYATVAYGGASVAPPGSVIAPFTVASGIEARLIEAEAAYHGVAAGTGDWLTQLNALRTSGVSTTIPAQTLFDTLGITHCGSSFGTCGNGDGTDTTAGKPNDYPGPGYTLASIAKTPNSGLSAQCSAKSWYVPCYVYDTAVVLTYTKPASVQWYAGIGGVNGLAPLTDPGTDSGRVALLFDERAYWLFLTGHRQGDLRRLVRNYHRAQNTVYPSGLYPGFSPFQQFGGVIDFPIPTTEQVNPLFHGCLARGA
jgi:hypothetical protein